MQENKLVLVFTLIISTPLYTVNRNSSYEALKNIDLSYSLLWLK